MKHIKITQYNEPNKYSVYIKEKRYYNVFIGLRRVYFSNEVRAKKFMADSNRMLNSTLHECNYLLGEIYIEYRKVWFYTNQYKKIEVDKEVDTRIQMINRHFDWLTTRADTSMNGNSNAFDFILKICDNLLFLVYIIQDVNQRKEQYSDIYRLDIFINQLNILKKRVEDWGIDDNELKTK